MNAIAASGLKTTALVVVSLFATALLIPTTLKLPVFLKVQVVFFMWWVIWAAVGMWLLIGGRSLSDDYQLHPLRVWFVQRASSSIQMPATAADSRQAWWDGLFWGWFLADALTWVVVVLCALLLVVVPIWVAVEVLIPVFVYMVYLTIRGMLYVMVKNAPRYKGRVLAALVVSVFWAGVYTVPLALATWGIHAAAQANRPKS